MTTTRKQQLKAYRAAIRAAWLPVVSREKLTPHEYELIESFFNQGISLTAILQAIKAVQERGAVVYSLGVIKSDLSAIQKQHAKLNAGAQSAQGDWRDQWEQDLKDLADDYPSMKGICQDFINDLPGMTLDQAKARWKEISR